MTIISTDTQTKAIEEIEHNLLLISGPGTGKTSIIARKVAYLLDQGYQTNEILVTTFTNKATDELKLRVAHYSKRPPHHLQIYTIHSFCRNIIKEFSYIIDSQADFKLLDEIDQKFLILQHSSNLGLSENSFSNSKTFYKNIFNLFGLYDSLNEHLIELDDMRDYIEGNRYGSRNFNLASDKGVFLKDSEIYSIFKNYRQLMWEKKWLDLSQALKVAYTLLKKHENVRKTLQKRYKYILVDEYQDTSYLQHEIFKLLVSENNKICAVGDDDQGIYQFRGATVHNLLNFKNDFPDVIKMNIGENFRSTEEIVQFAHHIIEENQNRFSKNLLSKRGSGSDVILIEGQTYRETARSICLAIKQLLESQTISSYSEIVLLFSSVRWDFIGTGYKDVFDQEEIPCVIHKSGSYFDHDDVRFFVDLLKMLVYNGEETSEQFYFILERLNFTEESLFSFAGKLPDNITLEKLFTDKLDKKYNISNPDDLKKLSAIYELFKELRISSNHNVLSILYKLFEVSDYFSRVLQTNDQKSLYQVAYLTKLVQSFEKWGGRSLKSFVDYLLIFRDKRTLEEIPLDEPIDGVHVSTIHSVKGLQYKVVFVCDFDPISHWSRSFQIPDDLLEKNKRNHLKSPTEEFENRLRLFYVGLTRAQDHLFLAYSKTNKNGYPTKDKPFLKKAIKEKKVIHFELNKMNCSPFPKIEKNEKKKISISLSYSSMRCYLSCPLRYQLEYVYKFISPINDKAVFGSMIHKVLERVFIAHTHSHKITEETIIEVLQDQLCSHRYKTNEEQEDTKKHGIDLLITYFRNHFPLPSQVHEIEKDFEVFFDENGQYRLIGSIDLILKTNDQNFEIVDFKTGKKDESVEEQLLTYALACDFEHYQKISGAKTHYLKENKIIYHTITPDKLDQIKLTITKIFESISQNHFSPSPSIKSCSLCPFQQCCHYSKFQKN